MALPKMTPEQQAAALEKAKKARAKRAALKADLKAGKKKLSSVLNSKDEIVKKTKVVQVLTALPGVGKITAEKAMEEIGIPEGRRVGGLGSKQKEALIEKFGK
ncbi:MAG: integration host factor, actinobacterial type [Coriobacteriia bacterium]|nr:integration host factor, actinobacterial type [Coriobacteriia bacterium]